MGITLPANLNLILQIVLFVLGAYVFALYLGLIVWTWRDIRARSRDLLTAFLSVLIVLLFNLPGLLLYLILRPREVLAETYARELEEEALLQEIEGRHACPECERRVEPEFVLCPWCHAALRNRCSACGGLLNLRWDVCPYCGEAVPVLEQEISAVEMETAPDAGEMEPVLDESMDVEMASDASGMDVALELETLASESGREAEALTGVEAPVPPEES